MGWRHASGDLKPRQELALDGGSNFSVTGVPIARNAAVLGLGAEMAVARNTTVGVGYDAQFGGGNRQQSGQLKLAVRFKPGVARTGRRDRGALVVSARAQGAGRPLPAHHPSLPSATSLLIVLKLRVVAASFSFLDEIVVGLHVAVRCGNAQAMSPTTRT